MLSTLAGMQHLAYKSEAEDERIGSLRTYAIPSEYNEVLNTVGRLFSRATIFVDCACEYSVLHENCFTKM